MANGLTNKELLVELRTDMKWLRGSVKSFKDVAVQAKDRSLKNEQDIKNFKWFVGITVSLAVAIGQGIVWLFKRGG